MTDPALQADRYLATADRLLTDVIKGTRGIWPRACAWLIRLALEVELTRFWQSAREPVARCTSHRARLLMLSEYTSPDVSRRAARAWFALSAAGHHHSYELGLAASELRHLRNEVGDIIAALRSEQAGTAPGHGIGAKVVMMDAPRASRRLSGEDRT